MITTLYQFADLLKDDENLSIYFSPAQNPFEGREEKWKLLVGNIEKGKFHGFQAFPLESRTLPILDGNTLD